MTDASEIPTGTETETPAMRRRPTEMNMPATATGRPERRFAPQIGTGSCACGAPNGTCACSDSDQGGRSHPFVYALGRVQPRFPRLDLEKELAQATGRGETAGLTDRQAAYAVLSKRENRYIARSLCWVFAIEGLETYILSPRDPADLELLIEALRPTAHPGDVDIVVGVRGPIAPLDMCNGLMVPIVVFDQLYSFDRDTLVKAIPKPDKIAAQQFQTIAGELFDRLVQFADNAGATDAHRAANYVFVRHPGAYALVAERYSADCALSGIEVKASPLSGSRKIVDVIMIFTHRATDVTEKYALRVDVTGEYPFLFTKFRRCFEGE
jgi:hypothetical protein